MILTVMRLEALAAIFVLNARRKPILVVLEDWHWADEASDSALRRLIGLIAGEPLQLVVLYRPEEYEPTWGRPRHLTPIDLAPLTPDDTAHIVRCVLGVDELPSGLMPRVHEVTGGNAFFDEEMALSLSVHTSDSQQCVQLAARPIRLISHPQG